MNDVVETVNGGDVPFYPDRMGWYYRPARRNYEFWWMGGKPLIILDEVMLDVMPTWIVMEIRASTTIKDELFD